MSDLSDMPCGGSGDPGGQSGAGRGGSPDRKRKREIQSASRKRIKQDKDSMETVIADLKDEIAKNKKTSESLKQKRKERSLKQEQLKKKQIELQRRIAELKKDEDKQIKQLKALSKHPNLGDQVGFNSLHIEMRRNELAVRSQINWDNWESEKTELKKEIAELKMENTILGIQLKVLDEKIIHCRE